MYISKNNCSHISIDLSVSGIIKTRNFVLKHSPYVLCEDKSSAIVRNEMKCHMVTVIGSHNIPCTNGKDRYREQDYYVHSKIVEN